MSFKKKQCCSAYNVYVCRHFNSSDTTLSIFTHTLPIPHCSQTKITIIICGILANNTGSTTWWIPPVPYGNRWPWSPHCFSESGRVSSTSGLCLNYASSIVINKRFTHRFPWQATRKVKKVQEKSKQKKIRLGQPRMKLQRQDAQSHHFTLST